ncbi:MAG: hypothetical protein KDB60_13480 [Propionibacteriaceae bacterium]|nr:hypothetical protein [Propionibacteriaceae bacterium]
MALSAAGLERVRAVKARTEDALLALSGVVAVDIDELVVDAGPVWGIVVYVHPGATPSMRDRVPVSIEDVPTEVRELTVELQGGMS